MTEAAEAAVRAQKGSSMGPTREWQPVFWQGNQSSLLEGGRATTAPCRPLALESTRLQVSFYFWKPKCSCCRAAAKARFFNEAVKCLFLLESSHFHASNSKVCCSCTRVHAAMDALTSPVGAAPFSFPVQLVCFCAAEQKLNGSLTVASKYGRCFLLPSPSLCSLTVRRATRVPLYFC